MKVNRPIWMLLSYFCVLLILGGSCRGLRGTEVGNGRDRPIGQETASDESQNDTVSKGSVESPENDEAPSTTDYMGLFNYLIAPCGTPLILIEPGTYLWNNDENLFIEVSINDDIDETRTISTWFGQTYNLRPLGLEQEPLAVEIILNDRIINFDQTCDYTNFESDQLIVTVNNTPGDIRWTVEEDQTIQTFAIYIDSQSNFFERVVEEPTAIEPPPEEPSAEDSEVD